MAVLTNTMMQGTAAISDEESYQISKSLRFNDGDSPFLNRSPSSDGNRRTWTLSLWAKDCTPSANTALFGDDGGSPNIYCYLMNNYQLRFAAADGSGGTAFQVDSVRLFRDPSAWYHFTFVVDTTNATSSERIRVYCNGERLAVTNTTYPDQHEEITGWNSDGATERIGQFSGGSFFDGYIADVQFIDGLALHPAAFGSFDSTGIFNPAEFSLPAPNNGTTWSSSGTVSGNATEDAKKFANLFDGALDTWSEQSGNDVTLTWTPGTPIPIKSSLRIYFAVGGDPEDTVINEKVMVNPAAGWVDVDIAGETTLTKFEMKRGGSGVYARASAIEIDGVILVDGQTDPTTRVNSNDGTKWSDALTSSTGSWIAWDYAGTYAFDGAPESGNPAEGSSGATITFAPTGGLAYKHKVEVLSYTNNSATFNGGSSQALVNDTWKTVASGEGTLTSLAISKSSGGGQLRGIKVDGHVLIDSSVDNSFHLKFNDTSSNAAIGYNSLATDFSSDDTKAINGLPILKTNRSGSAVTSGYRADDNSANLLLALPLNNLSDVHGSIQGNASNNISMTNDGVASETSTTKYYGTCQDWASGDRLYTASDSSLAWGTSNFTIEGWFNWDNNFAGSWAANRKYLFDNQTGSTGSMQYVRMFADGGSDSAGDGTILKTMNASGSDVTIQEMNKNQWYHIAMVRVGSTMKIYVDGQEKLSQTYGNSITGEVFTVGAYNDDSGGWWSGKIQDFKIYDTAVYTSSFKITRVPEDFTVNNLSHEEVAAAVYSDMMSGIGNWDAGAATGLFDGNTGTTPEFNSSGGNAVFTPSPAITYSGNLEIYTARTTAMAVELNDSGTDISYVGAGWTTLDTGGGTLTKMKFKNGSAGNQTFAAIRVDGSILIDTSAASLDVLNDSPTNYEDDSGNVHGNFCTWNPLNSGITLSQANLRITGTGSAYGTFLMPRSGKYYWEVTANSAAYIGIDNRPFGGSDYVHYNPNGQKQVGGGSTSSYGSSFTTGDVIGVAVDMTSQSITFYKNNTGQGAIAFSSVSLTDKDIVPLVYSDNSAEILTNFGQRSFKYTPPSGYKALCTQNLPDLFSGDNLNDPSKYFDVLTYVGTGASQVIKGLDFQPDLVWCKNRQTTDEHLVFDAVRGVEKYIYPSLTSAEGTASNTLTAFSSNGFTMGGSDGTNKSTSKMVAWCWDAGTSAATVNTDGGIDPTHSWANATAGFNIIRYQGNGSNSTVGHNLGAKPHFRITKWYSNSTAGNENWSVYHHSIGAGSMMNLDLTDAKGTSSVYFNNTEPTNNLFTVGTHNSVNENNTYFISYNWTAIPGFSKFGHYVGTGSSTNFIYLGFQPRWFLLKPDAGDAWRMFDAERNAQTNPVNTQLQAQANNAELAANDYKMHFNSNGIELQASLNSGINGSGTNFYYAAFASSPFKTARAQ